MLSSVRNKANSRRCRVGQGPGNGGRGSCTNKANSKGRHRPSGWSPRHIAPNKANLAQRQVRTSAGKVRGPAPAGRNRAKQSQFDPKRQTGQVLWAKGLMVSYTYTGPQQNKANSRQCRVERGQGDGGRAVWYKQSQFAAEPQVGGWTARSMRAKRSQFGPVVRGGDPRYNAGGQDIVKFRI
jgi:hypothetical protein